MCFIEARSKKLKVKPKPTDQTHATAPKPIPEEGPRIHLNFNGISGISFPAASVSKIPQYLFDPLRSAPAIAVLQHSSEFQSTSVSPKLKVQPENKPQVHLSTSISAQGNEIVKGAEELHRLTSRLEDASAGCSRSSRSSRRSRRSRSMDRSRGSDRSRERSERRIQKERESERELEREKEHIREWEGERERQRQRDRHREILALEALKREISNADKIKEIKHERKMEKAILNEVQSQMQKVSSQISSPVHGLGSGHEFCDPAPSSRRWNLLRWGPAMDNESPIRNETMRERNRERERRDTMGSLWEMAMGLGMSHSFGTANGGDGGVNRHAGAGGAGGSADSLHYHEHSHNHLHYNELPAATRGEHQHNIRRATAGDKERRKNSMASMFSIMEGDLMRKFCHGWTRAEHEDLIDPEKEMEKERKMSRRRERELERERGRERHGAPGSSYGYEYGERGSSCRRRGVIFDL